MNTGQQIRTLGKKAEWCEAFVLSPDGQTLISMNDTINVWDLRTGREIPTFMEHRDLASIALSRDGQTIVSSSYNGTIKVWGVP